MADKKFTVDMIFRSSSRGFDNTKITSHFTERDEALSYVRELSYNITHMTQATNIIHSSGILTIGPEVLCNVMVDIRCNFDDFDDFERLYNQRVADDEEGIVIGQDEIWACDHRNAKEEISILRDNGIIPSDVAVSSCLYAILSRYNSQHWHACNWEDITEEDRHHVVNTHDIVVLSQIGHLFSSETLRVLGISLLEHLVGMSVESIVKRLT